MNHFIPIIWAYWNKPKKNFFYKNSCLKQLTDSVKKKEFTKSAENNCSFTGFCFMHITHLSCCNFSKYIMGDSGVIIFTIIQLLSTSKRSPLGLRTLGHKAVFVTRFKASRGGRLMKEAVILKKGHKLLNINLKLQCTLQMCTICLYVSTKLNTWCLWTGLSN